MGQKQGRLGLILMFIFNPIIILFYQNCSQTTQTLISTQKTILRNMSSVEEPSALRPSAVGKNNDSHLIKNY